MDWVQTLIIGLIVAIVGGLIVVLVQYFARSGSSWVGRKRRDERIQSDRNDLMFGIPANEEAGTPGTKAWITTVNERLDSQDGKLDELAMGQEQSAARQRAFKSQMEAMQRAVDKILANTDTVVAEVLPDGNGGSNLRGGVDKAAAAARGDDDQEVHHRD